MTDDDKRELELALMSAQIETFRAEREKLQAESDKMRAEAERFRQEMKWEPYKAFAAIVGGILGASALMLGAILAVAHYIRP
jgi:hypothetical protein